MKTLSKMRSAIWIAALFETVCRSGCATPEWAKNDDWKKDTGWENEKTDNPGLWGAFEALGSLVNGR
jgi:hypothetical protein